MEQIVPPRTPPSRSPGPARQVTNITIQDKCPADPIEHDQTPNDPVVHQIVAHALGMVSGPADPAYQPQCV